MVVNVGMYYEFIYIDNNLFELVFAIPTCGYLMDCRVLILIDCGVINMTSEYTDKRHIPTIHTLF